jgi:hypothetical protein
VFDGPAPPPLEVQGTQRDSEGAGVRPARKVPTQSAPLPCCK